MTRADTLLIPPRVRVPYGDLVDAAVVGFDADSNLAVLRLPPGPGGEDGLPARRAGGFAAAFGIAPPPDEVRTGGPLVAPDGRFVDVVAAAPARLDAGKLTLWDGGD